jgi:hypothetical protein
MPLSLVADTVRLRDGSVLTGKVTCQDPSSITLESKDGVQSFSKSEIAAFREDDSGTESYKRRLADARAASETRQKQIDQAIADRRQAVPTGFWIGMGAGSGRIYFPQESILIHDRIEASLIPNGAQANAFPGFARRPANGEDANAGYQGDRFYVEADGLSYRNHLETAALGLPSLSSGGLNSSSSTQFWSLKGFGQLQQASLVAGVEPFRFSERFRIFLFAGKTGFNSTTQFSGLLFSPLVFTPSFYLTGFIQNFRLRLYGEGPRGGVQLRFEPAVRWEIRGQAAVASFAGNSSEHVTVMFGPFNIPGVTYQLPTKISTRGSLWVRQVEYTLTGFFALPSRVRLFLSYMAQDVHIQYGSRTNQNFPADLFLSAYFSQARFSEVILRQYDHPRGNGRFRRVSAGAEFRIY